MYNIIYMLSMYKISTFILAKQLFCIIEHRLPSHSQYQVAHKNIILQTKV